jgi:group II intron reverse transcriptase/maturase
MQGGAMKQTSLLGTAKKAAEDQTYRFQNLFGMLTVGYLLACWRLINKGAASGVDREDARSYEKNLRENVQGLVEAVKGGWYRAKLVLRKYLPKPNGKLRPLGIPAVADKLLQLGVAKILEEIYEEDFLKCSYGYRPRIGVLDAVRDVTEALRRGPYRYVVEADIRGFFDSIDHDKLIELLEKRIDDAPFLRLIRKWLKAGILDTDGKVIHPETGTPQGGIISPIIANVYLHYALDVWFEDVVKAHSRGAVYLCRYADDFICAFEHEADAEYFYGVLGARLGSFGLELAEEKTNLLKLDPFDRANSGALEFLGFEFRWGLGSRRKLVLKRRTARKKYRASLARMYEWMRANCRKAKGKFFAELNAKLRGYYNHYGIRGNYESIGDYYYQVTRMLHRLLNRRSQKRSYNWQGFAELIKVFKLEKPRICHKF